MKVPILGEERLSSDAMSETLVLAWLEGSGRITEKRSAAMTAELGRPREGWTWG